MLIRRFAAVFDMPERPPGLPDFAAIARSLELLAVESRLELLHALRTPQPLHEIRVAPSQSRKGENPERMISRQAIARHLEMLQDAGLVDRLPDATGRGERYVVNHERLFALVDEMRGLTRLRPVFTRDAGSRETMESDHEVGRAIAPPPRLLLAYGRDDGVSFPLADRPGAQWRLGRSPSCEVALDYDPYLSSVHCTIERTQDAFVLRDPGSRNGTWVNWDRVTRDAPRRLSSGDLITAGRSVLTFQA